MRVDEVVDAELGLADEATQRLGAPQAARAIFGELHEDRIYSIFGLRRERADERADVGVRGHGVDGQAAGDERVARGGADGADAHAGEQPGRVAAAEIEKRARARGAR